MQGFPLYAFQSRPRILVRLPVLEAHLRRVLLDLGRAASMSDSDCMDGDEKLEWEQAFQRSIDTLVQLMVDHEY